MAIALPTTQVMSLDKIVFLRAVCSGLLCSDSPSVANIDGTGTYAVGPLGVLDSIGLSFDGSHVHWMSSSGNLWVAPISGSERRMIFSLPDVDCGEYELFSQSELMPDGRVLVQAVCGTRVRASYLVNSDGGPALDFVPRRMVVGVASNGVMAVSRGRTLRLLDRHGTRVGRIALPSNMRTVYRVAFSPDGSEIAFSASAEQDTTYCGGPVVWPLIDIYVSGTDGSNLRKVTAASLDGCTGTIPRYLWPAWDPGGKLYYAEDNEKCIIRHDDGARVICGLTSTFWHQALFGFRQVSYLDPDEPAAIAFERNGKIFWARGDGQDADCLTPACSSCNSPVVSPNRTQVAYRSLDGGQESIRIVNRSLGTDEVVYPSAARWFRFSPDGQRLLLVAPVTDPARDAILEVVVGEETSEPPDVIKTYPLESVVDATYSAEGEAIFVSRGGNIYVLANDGTSERLLVEGGVSSPDFSYARMPAPSPDGGRLAFAGLSTAGPTTDPSIGDLFIADLATTRAGSYKAAINIRQLTADGGSSLPTWHARGNLLAFQAGPDIATMRPDGLARQTLLTDARWPFFNPRVLEADCDCACACETPCEQGEKCGEDCVCHPAPPDPPGPIGECRVACCDGFEATSTVGSEEECRQLPTTQGYCDTHCGVGTLEYEGRPFATGDCLACCALCSNRQELHEVVSATCGDCAAAAAAYCGLNDRGGLQEWRWDYCEP